MGKWRQVQSDGEHGNHCVGGLCVGSNQPLCCPHTFRSDACHPCHPPTLQVNQVLEVGDRSQGTNKYTAMSKWMQQLQTSHATVLNKLV